MAAEWWNIEEDPVVIEAAIGDEFEDESTEEEEENNDPIGFQKEGDATVTYWDVVMSMMTIQDYILANKVGDEALSLIGSLMVNLQCHWLSKTKTQATIDHYFNKACDV